MIGIGMMDCADANCSHSDTVASRTLERRVDLSNVTVEACIKECFVQSFTIAGLEYAQECCKSSTSHITQSFFPSSMTSMAG
jgi:hypothetical protein